MRRPVHDHLASFRRYLPGRVVYLNLAHKQQARTTRSARLGSDTALVVFHTTLLSLRWNLPRFEERMDSIAEVSQWEALKIAFPQDEFFGTLFLEHQFERFGVSHLFSAAPPSEWRKIYPRLSESPTKFRQVLTGYIDEELVRKVGPRAAGVTNRPVAIGYRAWKAEPWLGRLGQLKASVGDAFLPYNAPGFRVDVSTKHEDTFFGAGWYRFLQRCRAMPGSGSGASILDSDGSLRRKTQEFLAAHPTAPYEEVEQECFPGRDGELALNVLGPRHLEACLTRTCQILIPADYSGVLRSEEHYIPLEPDFSNIDATVDAVRDDKSRAELVERTYADVVEHGGWSYRRFIEAEISPLMDESGASGVGFGVRASDAASAVQRRVRDAGLALLTTAPRWTARVLRALRIPVTEDTVIRTARSTLAPFRRRPSADRTRSR